MIIFGMHLIDFNPLDRYGLPKSRGIREARCKFIASMLMKTLKDTGIVVPTYSEWIGFNMMERDDELAP